LKLQKLGKVSHFDRLDQHRDLLTVPSDLGDLLILDLRVDHKGTPARKPAPYPKYGIMNIACSGQATAERLRAALRRRPSGYYRQYLAQQPRQTPALARVEAASELTVWL
jgi:hypothetical protein